MAGNYDRMQESARLLFLKYEPEKLRKRLSLPRDPAGIPIRFLGEDYLVRREDGEVVDARRTFNYYAVVGTAGQTR